MSADAPKTPGKGSGRSRFIPKLDPVAHPASESSVWNLPNGLTMLRLVLVVPFGILLFGYGTDELARTIAAVIFVFASITDFADGAIARRLDIVTTFGKIADPIADKALTGVALIGLSYLQELPWWVTIVILFRELAVTCLRFWVIRHGVISASVGGKAKTVAQIVAILLFLLPTTGFWLGVADVVMGVAVVLTVATGIDYLVRAIRLRRTAIPSTDPSGTL